MDKKEELKKGLEELLEEGMELSNLIAGSAKLTGTIFVEFGTKYQKWYTKALRVVEGLAPDRLEEFIGYYRVDPKRKAFHGSSYVIQDFVMGRRATSLAGWSEHPNGILKTLQY